MKPQLILILVLFFTPHTSAQSWTPVRVGDVYHYAYNYGLGLSQLEFYVLLPNNSFSSNPTGILLPSNNPIVNLLQTGVKNSFSVRIDSSYIDGGDTHYGYSKRYVVCDSCPVIALEKIQVGDSASLVPKTIKKANGNYLIIFNNDTIKLAADILSTNFYDALKQRSTTVTSIDSTTLFNWTANPVHDSIVVIEVVSPIAQNYYFSISKNFGIIDFGTSVFSNSSILLIGKEGLVSGGRQSLKFGDIFDFNIGDEFYYHNYQYASLGWMPLNWPYQHFYCRYRDKVIGKNIISIDSIVYTYERIYYSQLFNNYNLFLPTTITKTFTNSDQHPYGFLDGELSSPTPFFSERFISKDFIDGDKKYLGYDMNVTDLVGLGNDNYVSIFHDVGSGYYQAAIDQSYDYAILLEKGLGETYHGSWSMDSYLITILQGYIKGADTVGITPEIIITGSNTVKNNQDAILSVRPNPTTDYLNIYYQTSQIGKQLTFSVLDMQGRVLQTYRTADVSDKTYIVPVYDLVAGMYVLEVRRDGKLLKSEQFVKQ